MLLVSGPSGNVGNELVSLLNRQERPRWRAASRHPDALRARLGSDSAEVVRLDFFDPSTWDQAVEDVDCLFLLFPLPGNRSAREAIIPFVSAAERAGCRHVVYVSVFGADRAGFIPHFKVEGALRDSSMTWTVLRCGFFMQNLHRQISTHGIDIIDHGELFIPAGGGRTTFLDARDAAAVAAMVLDNPDEHRNVVHHLTGPAALTMDEVAETLAAELGTPVVYTAPNLISFVRRLRSRGVGWDSVGFMCAVYTLTRFGANRQITEELSRLLDRPPRTLAEFVHDSAWRWRERAWT